jgi:phosphate-selective porin OprO and OprP
LAVCGLRMISTTVLAGLALGLSGCAFGPKQLERRDGQFSDAVIMPVTSCDDQSKSQNPIRPADYNAEEKEREPGKELCFEKPDDKKYLSFEVLGRIQAEAIMVSQTEKDKAILGDFQNAVGFRRARLGAKGDVGEQVHWITEFDFAGGSVALKDIFISLDKLPVVRQVRVGNFMEPFSLEGATSSNVFPFCERSAIMALDPARHWGVGVFSYTENERFTFQAGVFRSGSGSNGNDIGDGNDMAYTVRVTGLPWFDCSNDCYRLIHVGGAFSQTFPKNDDFTLNQGPQNSLLESVDNPLSPFQSNIVIPASQYQLYNVQSAAVWGPLCVQAEWTAAEIDQIGGGPVLLNGCYVFASFFLTGEHRQYDTKNGEFGVTHVLRPFVRMTGAHNLGCGPGAWELTARFAYSNFNNANIPLTSTGFKQGDRLAETTLGINWYLNDNTRIMFNYVNAVPDDPNFGPSGANAFYIQSAIFW